MRRTRMLTLGVGFGFGGLCGAAATTVDFAPPAAAQERPDEDREPRARKAIELAKALAEVRAKLQAAAQQGDEKRADELERKLRDLAGILRDLVHDLQEHDQRDALEQVERILRGDEREGRRPGPDAGRDRVAEAAKRRLMELKEKIGELQRECDAARERREPERAAELRAVIQRLTAEAMELSARMQRGGPGDRPGPDGQPGPDGRPGPDGGLDKLERLRDELHGRLEKLERKLEGARAEGAERAVDELERALDQTRRDLQDVEGRLRHGGDRPRDGRPGGDDAARKLRDVERALEQAHRKLQKTEEALHQAEERGEERQADELRAVLEKLVEYVRQLEEVREELDAHAARGPHEPGRPGGPEWRGPDGRGVEPGSVEALRQELRAVREELGALRRQMEQMHEMLAHLLHGGGPGPDGGPRPPMGPRGGERGEDREQEPGRRGDRRPRRIERGRWPGLPGLPGRSGNDSLDGAYEAIVHANEVFQGVARHLQATGANDEAISAFNHAHEAYAQAMNVYRDVMNALHGRPLSDRDGDLAAHLDRALDALAQAVERMRATAGQGDGARRR